MGIGRQTTYPLITWGLVTAVACWLSACARNEKVPLSDRITLEYTGASDDDFLFKLSNGTSAELKFFGWPRSSSESIPSYSGSCVHDVAGSPVLTIIVGPSMQEYSLRQTLSASSGEAIRLAIPKYEVKGHEGGQCTITLTFESGAKVESKDFSP